MCLNSKPSGSECIAYSSSEEHAKEAECFFVTKMIDKETCDQGQRDKSNQIAAGWSKEFARTTGKAGKYRDSNQTDQKIDQVADGSFFRSQNKQGKINNKVSK